MIRRRCAATSGFGSGRASGAWLPSEKRKTSDARETSKIARGDGKVDGDGGGCDDEVVRANRRTLGRQLGAQPRVHASHFEVERNHRDTIEQTLDESFGLRLLHATLEPVNAMQQLRRGYRGDRHFVIEMAGKRGLEIECSAFGGNEAARIDQESQRFLGTDGLFNAKMPDSTAARYRSSALIRVFSRLTRSAPVQRLSCVGEPYHVCLFLPPSSGDGAAVARRAPGCCPVAPSVRRAWCPQTQSLPA